MLKHFMQFMVATVAHITSSFFLTQILSTQLPKQHISLMCTEEANLPLASLPYTPP